MKSNAVGIFEAKAKLSSLIRQVQRGQRVVITNHGAEVAELVSLGQRPQARRGSGKSKKFFMADDFDAPLDDFADYQ